MTSDQNRVYEVTIKNPTKAQLKAFKGLIKWQQEQAAAKEKEARAKAHISATAEE